MMPSRMTLHYSVNTQIFAANRLKNIVKIAPDLGTKVAGLRASAKVPVQNRWTHDPMRDGGHVPVEPQVE